MDRLERELPLKPGLFGRAAASFTIGDIESRVIACPPSEPDNRRSLQLNLTE